MDYNARYYSARLGRFISPDTIVPEPKSGRGFNRYRYARNNPLKYTDPSGHCVWDLCIVEGAIIGAGIVLAVDYAVQVSENLDAGMSFGEAVYYQNINTQELGGAMLLGAGGGAVTAAAAPAVAPYAYHYADKVNAFGQTPGGRMAGNAVEGAAEGCLENCTVENVVTSAVEEAVFGKLSTMGTPGRGRNVREVTGGEDEARSLFDELAKGAEVRPHPNPDIPGGSMADLPGGGTIGFRPTSKSGPPTIDIHNVPDYPDLPRKIKFVPEE